MLDQPVHSLRDLGRMRDVVARNPWALLASDNPDGPPIVSHLPVLLDPASEGLVILSHLGREDAEQLHQLGSRPVTLVIQGAHGYISPSFYGDAGPYVPTWNFVVLHLEGIPQVLDDAQTWDILVATVERFENERAAPWKLDAVDEYARRIAPWATGFRLDPTRVVAKAKLNQDKPREVMARVIEALESDPHHGDPVLAEVMREELAATSPGDPA